MHVYKRYATAQKHTQPGRMVVHVGDLYIANVDPYTEVQATDPCQRTTGGALVQHLAMGNHNRCNVAQEGRAAAKAAKAASTTATNAATLIMRRYIDQCSTLYEDPMTAAMGAPTGDIVDDYRRQRNLRLRELLPLLPDGSVRDEVLALLEE